MEDQVENTEVKKKTKTEFVEALKREFYELQSISDNIKQLKDDAKDAGYDSVLLAKVAKALSEAKADEILDKNEAFANLVDEVRND